MDPKHLAGIDDRLLGMCAYCGGAPGTRDHVPSKVLLDQPYPPNLGVVEACRQCNNSFSRAEAYVACLVECVIAGTAQPEKLRRKNIACILRANPKLASRIAASRVGTINSSWRPDMALVRQVGHKLAQGHAAWDLALPCLGTPTHLVAMPLPTMSDEERSAFEWVVEPILWPEVGSRRFYAVIRGKEAGWINLQADRYRYQAHQEGCAAGMRIVLSEYIAYGIMWN